MLIILGGLPATGKSTIAKALSAKRGATYVRVDEIEQALAGATGRDAGKLGYAVAQAIAGSNLQLGHEVVADSVNPVEESRKSWRKTATRCGSPFIEVELVCGDSSEHRARAEARNSDIDGLINPSWAAICKRHYEEWNSVHLRLDTACIAIDEAVVRIEAELTKIAGNRSS